MNIVTRFKSLPISSRRLLGIGILMALVVALPLFIWAVITQRFLFIKHAASGEPTPTIPINWTYGSVSITADDFYLISNGKRYDGNSNINVNPGPSGANAQEIEVASNMYGDNLKLQMMFRKDKTNWWVDQITFVNSNFTPDTSSFTGTFFKSVLGKPFQDMGNIAMIIKNPSNGQEVAELHYTNLRIQGFVTQVQPPQGGECQMCGGIANIQCGGGLICQRTGRVSPDAAGICVKRDGSSRCATPTPTPGPGQRCSSNADCKEIYCPGGSFVHEVCVGGKCVLRSACPTPTTSPACGTTCGTNYNCQSGLVCFNGFCRNPDCTSKANCVCPTGAGECQMCGGIANIQCGGGLICQRTGQVSIPEASGICVKPDRSSHCGTTPPTAKSFQINFKFGGVRDGSASNARVVVRFKGGPNSSIDYSTPPIPANSLGNGIYQLYFATELPDATNYAISLKGEKHLAVRFCAASGQITHCSDGAGNINVYNASGPEFLDLTGIPLEPGDLYPQDGTANTNDFAKITALLTKPHSELTSQDLLIGDLNYDGYVNILDAFLMRQTLQTRYDEN